MATQTGGLILTTLVVNVTLAPLPNAIVSGIPDMDLTLASPPGGVLAIAKVNAAYVDSDTTRMYWS